MMITPDLLKELTTYKKQDLVDLLDKAGYTDWSIKYSKFRGVNRDGHFVYEITYRDLNFHNLDETGFIRVKFDHNLLTVSAEF
jgi:hypothetical protein